jgi:pentatricopeptide repeat protein
LNTAARHGDVVLARDVFQSLFERSSNLDEQHYEMVAEAYANSGDMDGALGVVCEMSTAKMVIDKSTTRPIFRAFENHDPTPLSRILHEAFEGLSKLEQRHVKVPIVAINVLIELGAAAFLPGQDRRLSEVAFSIYDRLRMVCHDGPNIDTYCLMFDICRRFGRMDKIPELVNEITQMKQIKPDLQFFDTLILTYLYHMDETAAATGQVLLTSTESFQAAFQYYGETKRRGLRPSRRVVSRIYKILLHANDRRASEVLRDVKRWAAQDDTWGKLERKQWKVGIGEETEESDEELEDALPAKRAGPENAAAEGLNL